MVDVATVINRTQRVNLLLHLQRVQRRYAEDLGFTTLEQRRAVGTRNKVDLNIEISNILDAATVDAEAVGQNTRPDDLFCYGVMSSTDFRFTLRELFEQRLNRVIHV